VKKKTSFPFWLRLFLFRLFYLLHPVQYSTDGSDRRNTHHPQSRGRQSQPMPLRLTAHAREKQEKVKPAHACSPPVNCTPRFIKVGNKCHTSRSEIPHVKYARIQGSHFGRNFHRKCKIPWKSLNFVGILTRKWFMIVILTIFALFLLNFNIFHVFH